MITCYPSATRPADRARQDVPEISDFRAIDDSIEPAVREPRPTIGARPRKGSGIRASPANSSSPHRVPRGPYRGHCCSQVVMPSIVGQHLIESVNLRRGGHIIRVQEFLDPRIEGPREPPSLLL